MKPLLKLALILACVGVARGQAYRADPFPSSTTANSVPSSANTNILAIPGATISLCTTANCSAQATAYTDNTATTACPAYAPVTWPGTTTCVSTSNPQGKFGFWLLPQTAPYYFRITARGSIIGTYPLSVAAGGSGSGLAPPGSGNVVLKYISGLTTGAALFGDIVGLWTGPCNNTTYLRGDGNCGTPSGTGTVSSITATAPLTGGTITSAGSIGCSVAGSSQAGCLSSSDWSLFNGKQAAGSYLTALTGDGIATGPGSVGFTLSSVNGTPGTFGSSTNCPTFTVNAKGLITNASQTACAASSGSPLTTKGDIYGFNTANARIPVGTNGQVLTADSTNGLGVSWQSVSGGSGIPIGTFAARPPTPSGGTGSQWLATDNPLGIRQLSFYNSTSGWTPALGLIGGNLLFDTNGNVSTNPATTDTIASATTLTGKKTFAGGFNCGEETVTWASSVAFSPSLCNSNITLLGATAFTISNGNADGDPKYLLISDTPGGSVMTAPSNVTGFMTPALSAGQNVVISLIWNSVATKWRVANSGSGGAVQGSSVTISNGNLNFQGSASISVTGTGCALGAAGITNGGGTVPVTGPGSPGACTITVTASTPGFAHYYCGGQALTNRTRKTSAIQVSDTASSATFDTMTMATGDVLQVGFCWAQ